MRTGKRYVVLGPPKKDPDCFVVYDTVMCGTIPLESVAEEYLTYEDAQIEADKRNNI